MTEDNKNFETWADVIVDFFTRKKESEEDIYLKEEIKKIAEWFKNQKYCSDCDIQSFFEKDKKDKNELSIDFQRKRFQTILTFKEKTDTLDLNQINEAYQTKCKTISDKFEPRRWITAAAQNSDSVNFATHVIKLTHSKIDSSSFYDQIASQKVDTLSTASLKEKITDGAVSGNQFSPIYQFLELELNGRKLASIFSDLNNEILTPFSHDSEELENWNKGFNKSLSTGAISSHSLAKQIFFPLNTEQGLYHLLCPVKSSSLAQGIFEKIFDGQQKTLRNLRDKNVYSKSYTTSFINKASVSVTASNHSNASQLNGKRGGKLYLFSSIPPTWQSQFKPPINSESFFYSIFPQKSTWTTIDYLRDFLLRFQRIELSIKDPERLKWIVSWVSDVIDDVLAYAAVIQDLQPGWSNTEGIRLKPEHQYFLDPYREDEAFQTARKASDWQSAVCRDFAHWLNQKLIGEGKQFTPQREHRRLWIALMEQPLREFNQTIEVEIKTQVKEKS
jgi:CRISPR-associated protein Csy1